jgi:hypothetical protein
MIAGNPQSQPEFDPDAKAPPLPPPPPKLDPEDLYDLSKGGEPEHKPEKQPEADPVDQNAPPPSEHINCRSAVVGLTSERGDLWGDIEALGRQLNELSMRLNEVSAEVVRLDGKLEIWISAVAEFKERVHARLADLEVWVKEQKEKGVIHHIDTSIPMEAQSLEDQVILWGIIEDQSKRYEELDEEESRGGEDE